MLKKIKDNITRYILNIPGWRSDRKIVVIESGAWGSVRMPSKILYEKLLKGGGFELINVLIVVMIP